ncbi:MAG: Sec-independent protein translocase protein TatB [Acidimicrobiaceae bacterium]|nr:Sec-independent protein translocase protein TatB [Acidimicrobiaceae bacterium]
MGNLGGSEILVIFLVGLVVLGPTRLPEVTRQIGRILREVRRVSTGFQEELRAAVEDPGLELEARARGDALTSQGTSASSTDPRSDPPPDPEPHEGSAGSQDRPDTAESEDG